MRQTFDETTDRSFGPKHLPRVRERMAAQGLDGFLVPHEDEHQNEYLPKANDRLGWLTGFTGSAGAAVVLKDKAAVFVDGRYTLQVRDQVDESVFEIRDLVDGGVPLYLESATQRGAVIGYDPKLHSPDALHWLLASAEKAGATLKPVSPSPLDEAWGAERPAQPQAQVVAHPLEFTGETRRRSANASVRRSRSRTPTPRSSPRLRPSRGCLMCVAATSSVRPCRSVRRSSIRTARRSSSSTPRR